MTLINAVEGRLKELRALYHSIEAAPSVHTREEKIRSTLLRIFEDVLLWSKEKNAPEVQEKLSRLEKTFYQVKHRWELRRKEPLPSPAVSAEDLLEKLEEHLTQTRRLYHRIQAPEFIEPEVPSIRHELREIHQHMETLKKMRPDKREEDVATKANRLKVTLYEVESFLEEHIDSSFLALVLSEKTKIHRVQKVEGIIKSKEKVNAVLEKLRKQAEDLGAKRPLIKKAITILDLEAYLLGP